MALLQCLLHHTGEVGAHIQGLPRGLSGKESACNAGDPGSILGSGRSPGIGSGSSLQYSCLGNFTDRGAWQATVHGVAKSWAQLSSRGTKANVLKAVIESGDICQPLGSSVWRSGILNPEGWEQRTGEGQLPEQILG